MAHVTSYDPDIYPAEITFRLVFVQWAYRAEFESSVRGHVRGMRNLNSAIDELYEQLLGDNDIASMLLVDAEGDTLECSDDDDDGEDWLLEMLVSAEVIRVEHYDFGPARAASAPSPARSETP